MSHDDTYVSTPQTSLRDLAANRPSSASWVEGFRDIRLGQEVRESKDQLDGRHHVTFTQDRHPDVISSHTATKSSSNEEGAQSHRKLRKENSALRHYDAVINSLEDSAKNDDVIHAGPNDTPNGNSIKFSYTEQARLSLQSYQRKKAEPSKNDQDGL